MGRGHRNQEGYVQSHIALFLFAETTRPRTINGGYLMSAIGFEYQGKRGATAFEVFLRYTDEKEKSSVMLGRLLEGPLQKKGAALLDVGAGNGKYLKLALDRVRLARQVQVTLLEPSRRLVGQLRGAVNDFPPGLSISVLQSTLEEYNPGDQFDVIVASHLPFPMSRLQAVYARLLAWLKPHGSLIVVLRDRDDVHDFRTRFKSRLLEEGYHSLTIGDAVATLKELGRVTPLRVSISRARAGLRIPILSEAQDTRTIIEFLLNTRWADMPIGIRQDVLAYLKERNGELRLDDGFARVEKLSVNVPNPIGRAIAKHPQFHALRGR